MTKIGVIGPGLIGAKHISEINKSKDCELGFVVGRSIKSVLEKKLDINCPIFSSIDEALEKVCVDGLIVCTPNDMHLSSSITALKKKIPVLIEKPIAHSLEDATALLDLSENEKTPVLIGHHRHHNNKLKRFQHILKSGVIGKIVTFQGTAQYYKPEYYFKDGPWRTEKGTGGPGLINLIHEIGIIRHLVGEVVEINVIKTNQNRRFDVEDTIAISFQTKNDVIGTFILSDCVSSPFSWENTSGENSMYPKYKEDCYNIGGTHGTFCFPSGKLYTTEDQNWWKTLNLSVEKLESEDTFSLQLAHFLDIIKRNAMPLVSARDGLNNLKLALEIINQ